MVTPLSSARSTRTSNHASMLRAMKALEMKKSTMVGTTARTMIDSVRRTVSLEPKIPAR